jgi:copper(I)-binding protein
MHKTIIALIILLAASLFSTLGVAADAIEIENPQARAMLPGAKVGGGYLSITNNGPESDRLVTVSSDRAKSVQIHQMVINDGIMIMRELHDGIEVPAGKTIAFKPGAYHLMFMDVVKPFNRGETLKATLTFAKAGSVEVAFLVGSAGGDMSAPAEAERPVTDANAMVDMDMSNMDMGKADMDAMDMSDMPGRDMDPRQSIQAVMRKRFETPDKPLIIDPIVVQNDWAIADWQQDGRGGRALLKKGVHGWTVNLCSGDSLKDAAALEKIGVAAPDAKDLTAQLMAAEGSLKPDTLALFASFEGTVILDQEDAGGHADHTGHNQ